MQQLGLDSSGEHTDGRSSVHDDTGLGDATTSPLGSSVTYIALPGWHVLITKTPLERNSFCGGSEMSLRLLSSGPAGSEYSESSAGKRDVEFDGLDETRVIACGDASGDKEDGDVVCVVVVVAIWG